MNQTGLSPATIRTRKSILLEYLNDYWFSFWIPSLKKAPANGWAKPQAGGSLKRKEIRPLWLSDGRSVPEIPILILPSYGLVPSPSSFFLWL
jgi:hypothetical protein